MEKIDKVNKTITQVRMYYAQQCVRDPKSDKGITLLVLEALEALKEKLQQEDDLK